MQFGLLGRKLGHSLSPQIHALFGDYPYHLFEREPEDLPAFFADRSLAGFNVTIPYKVDALRFCAALSNTAKKIGSVNTVIRRADGTLFGDNTDYFGFSHMAALCGASFNEKKVVILGSGGASRTVQAVAADAGAAQIVVVSRSGKENYENLSRHYDAQILVNTTPVGMFPNNLEAPVSLDGFSRLEAVLDLIYNPMRTALLTQAQEREVPSANGLSMLVAQALRSAEQFLQKELDERLIAETVKTIEAQQRNIVLIGMPGCGKSTVGALLQDKLGKELLDTDALVETADGRSIPQIFRENGEAVFRALETDAVKEAGKQLGKVIATGGGAVMNETNRAALKQNGTVVYLKKELDTLAREGRPLSTDRNALRRIYEQRKEIYESFADFTVDVSEDPAVTAERVIKCIC